LAAPATWYWFFSVHVILANELNATCAACIWPPHRPPPCGGCAWRLVFEFLLCHTVHLFIISILSICTI
jgi:hypothetical protein